MTDAQNLFNEPKASDEEIKLNYLEIFPESAQGIPVRRFPQDSEVAR